MKFQNASAAGGKNAEKVALARLGHLVRVLRGRAADDVVDEGARQGSGLAVHNLRVAGQNVLDARARVASLLEVASLGSHVGAEALDACEVRHCAVVGRVEGGGAPTRECVLSCENND